MNEPEKAAPAGPAKKTRLVIWILLGVVALVGVVWYLVFTASKPEPAAAPVTSEAKLVRENNHRVTDPATEKAQLVEFLDFECEACLAMQPVVEELKKEFGDRVTFVNRYFPLPAHLNSANAALAVEAAAQQGKYEQMYAKMFETQAQWGEQKDSKAPLFRTYARDLGLDMEKYDADVASEETKAVIRQDITDGTALGVQGTPTFFLNGKILNLTSEEDFRQQLSDASK